MVVSGTLRLPLQRSGAQIEDVRRCDTVLRDLVYNPDRYLREDSNAVKSSECDKWIAEKKQWIETPLTPENGSARHRGIERCNQALQAFVNQRAHGLRAKRRALMEKIRADKVLVARDYAFCLFPENLLHEFLIDSVAESL